MGSCWPKPVDNLPTNTSTTDTRAPSPVHSNSDAKTMKNRSQNQNQNQSRPPSIDRGGGGAAVPASGEIVIPNLKAFKLEELRSATRDFRPDTVLGEGGFGTVYKGYVDQKTYAPSRVGIGIPVAVKKSNPDSEQGLKEWQEFNAKLSDFGLAKLGPVDGNSHVTTKVVGTYGYAAPEYLATGHLYVKSDVYGFGVVLLEIITGLQVLDLNRPGGQTNLVDWAKPSLPDKKKLRKLIDPRFMGQYPFKAAIKIAELILNCIEPDPKRRPDMEEVLESLEKINTISMKPNESKPKTQLHANHRHHNHDGSGGARGSGGGGGGHRQYNNLNGARSY